MKKDLHILDFLIFFPIPSLTVRFSSSGYWWQRPAFRQPFVMVSGSTPSRAAPIPRASLKQKRVTINSASTSPSSFPLASFPWPLFLFCTWEWWPDYGGERLVLKHLQNQGQDWRWNKFISHKINHLFVFFRRGKRRVTRLVVVVVLVFAICWCPIQVRR